MITDAGNKYANELLNKAKELDASANIYAVLYADSDNKEHQAQFKKLAEKADFIRKMYSEFCNTMHAIEAENDKSTFAEGNRMTTLFEKYKIAQERADRYKEQILDIARAQLQVAVDVFVVADGKRPLHFYHLPSDKISEYFTPCEYPEILDWYDDTTIKGMWAGSGEADYYNYTFKLHPIMMDETVTLVERKETLREVFLEIKNKYAEQQKRKEVAKHQARRKQMIEQLAEIEDKLIVSLEKEHPIISKHYN